MVRSNETLSGSFVIASTSKLIYAELFYDGECPFCAHYTQLLEIRQEYDLQLVDARSDLEIHRSWLARGYDLNEGMILVVGDHIFFADECISFLASISSGTSVISSLHRAIFSSRVRSRLTYPVLVFCRNLTLRMLRRKKF